MRPIRITIEGINSFTEPQTLDFERVGADGLFCISGTTGSGKTTVLDCMILALYQPSGKRGNLSDYVNLRVESGKIDFVFELDGKIYETVRVLSRKQSKNSYVVKEDGEPIAEGGDGYALVAEKIGLGRDEFTNVVVLQQGEFARFLNATKRDRVALVSKLFGLKRFDGLYTKFNAAANEERNKASKAEGVVETVGDVSRESIKAKTAELADKESRLVALAKEAKRAAEIVDETRRGRELFIEQTRLRKEIEENESKVEILKKREFGGAAYFEEIKKREVEVREREAKTTSLTQKKLAIENAKKRAEELAANLKNLEAREEKLAFDEKKLAERSKLADEKEREKTLLEARSDELRKSLGGGSGTDAAAKKAEIEAEIRSIKSERDRFGEENKRVESATKEVERAEAVWKSCSIAAAESEKREAASEAELKAARAALDEAIAADALGEVCAHVKAGDECPICGGIITTVKVAARGERKAAAARADEAEARAKAARTANAEAAAAFREAAVALEGAKRRLDEATERRKTTAEKLNGRDEKTLTSALEALTELTDVEAKRDRLASEVELERRAAASERGLLTDRKAELATERKKNEAELKTTKVDEVELERIDDELRAVAEARKKLNDDYDRARSVLDAILREKSEAEARLKAAKSGEKPFREVSEDELKKAENAATAAEEERRKLNDETIVFGALLEKEKSGLEKKEAAERELKECKKRLSRYESLAKLTSRSAFTEYVAAEYVKDFTQTASVKLSELTAGKYSLEYDEESGEFFVVDFLSGNEKRNAKTLSGGETFLASLSLAIAISHDVARDRSFDFFFVDEGFGTLSPDALDSVVAALETLSRETMVGIITHRGELIERIGSVVTVSPATETSGSTISAG